METKEYIHISAYVSKFDDSGFTDEEHSKFVDDFVEFMEVRNLKVCSCTKRLNEDEIDD